jgi:hypothetical protein
LEIEFVFPEVDQKKEYVTGVEGLETMLGKTVIEPLLLP